MSRRFRYDVAVKYNTANQPIDVVGADQVPLNVLRYAYDGISYTYYAGDTLIPADPFVGCPSPSCVYPTVRYDVTVPQVELAIGQTAWNSVDGTLDIGMGNGVIQQVGMETYYHVDNRTGVTIPNGTVVSAVGTLGNSGKILVAPAIANGTQGYEIIIGIATADIPHGQQGLVTKFGAVRGLNTTGSSVGETWVNGDKLWVHPSMPGKLTKVRPSAPNLNVLIAMVTHAHNNGILLVRVTNGAKLGDLHDVFTNGSQDGDALVWNSGLTRYEIQSVKPKAVPFSDSTTPKVGEIRFDSGFLYVRVNSTTWKKVALSDL